MLGIGLQICAAVVTAGLAAVTGGIAIAHADALVTETVRSARLGAVSAPTAHPGEAGATATDRATAALGIAGARPTDIVRADGGGVAARPADLRAATPVIDLAAILALRRAIPGLANAIASDTGILPGARDTSRIVDPTDLIGVPILADA